MDPIAHTLAGATLAQTGLKKVTPLATVTLVLAANLPDIDALMMAVGRDASLYYRRGITHGILAIALMPVLLTLAIITYDRFLRIRKSPEKPPANALGLLLLSYLGVLSHPLLDWLNTYGVRLLMPFDGRWFYGDTLFIIDAWMWLLMGAAVAIAYSRTKLGIALVMLLGVATSVLITLASIVPIEAKVTWWLGIAGIVGLRVRGVDPRENQNLARGCIVAFCLYLAALAAGNSWAHQEVKDWIEKDSGPIVTDLLTSPVPANPFYRDVLVATNSHYHGVRVSIIGRNEIEPLFEPVRIEKPDRIVATALAQHKVRGFVNWMRFPTYEVRPKKNGYLVIIRDLRYVRPDQEPGVGIGIAEVFVKKEWIDRL